MFLEQQIRRISEGSSDNEDWSNAYWQISDFKIDLFKKMYKNKKGLSQISYFTILLLLYILLYF